MNAVDIRNYVSVKSCCLSTKGLSLLDKMRGGQMDPCCMTKHVTARTVSDLMSKAPVQDTWQKATYTVEGRYIGDPMTWSYWETTNALGETIQHGRVPNGQPSYTIPVGYATPGKGFELGQIITELFNQGSSDPLNLQIKVVNTTPPSPPQNTFTLEVTLYANDNYFDSAGNFVGIDLNAVFTGFTLEIEEDENEDPIYTINPTTERLYPCLTSSDICDLASFLDDYCDSCNEYEPENVTN